MTEPDVTLTDYALAVQAAVLMLCLWRHDGAAHVRRWWMLFFGSVSVATLLGGTVHGFFLAEDTIGHQLLWRGTLLAIGGATLAQWMIAGLLTLSARGLRWLRTAAFLQLILYSALALGVTQAFWLPVASNLPAVLLLMTAFGWRYRQTRATPLLIAMIGPMMTIGGGVLQQLQVAVHPLYLTHNALYHVLQMIGLMGYFTGARWMIRSGSFTSLREPQHPTRI